MKILRLFSKLWFGESFKDERRESKDEISQKFKGQSRFAPLAVAEFYSCSPGVYYAKHGDVMRLVKTQ